MAPLVGDLRPQVVVVVDEETLVDEPYRRAAGTEEEGEVEALVEDEDEWEVRAAAPMAEGGVVVAAGAVACAMSGSGPGRAHGASVRFTTQVRAGSNKVRQPCN